MASHLLDFLWIVRKMGLLESFLTIMGFGIGIPIGLLLGFFLFKCFQPTDFKDPGMKHLHELDSSLLVDLVPKLPLWVMNPDYERVDWLNKFITSMWPYFDKVASGIIKTSLEPMFAEYVGSYNIKSITFEHFTLGTLSPKIHGLKAQESVENELVIDLALRWAGNSNVVLVIQLLSLQLKIQLVDLQVSAGTRIFLRPLVPTFPCFSSIAMSLMEKPQIDFGLRVMGADIMAVPGLYQIVQDLIANQVAKLYLWPLTYEFDLLDSSIGATKKPVGILRVKIMSARHLLKMDVFGTSDPYVKLSLTGESLRAKKTSVKKNNLNPDWNENFKLIVKEPESQALHLQLYDWEKVGAHDYLGMQVVPLSQFTPYEKKVFTLPLLHSLDPSDIQNKKPRGHVTFEMSFIPFFEDSKKLSVSHSYGGSRSSDSGHENMSLSGSGLLLVSIISAEDIEGKNHNNPYVTIVFRGEQRNTKCMKKTRHPHWNEEFEFVLEEAPVKDLIHIEVTSKRRRLGITSKESLGHVDINLADVVYNGHINEKYHLINSRYGLVHLDIRWKVV